MKSDEGYEDGKNQTLLDYLYMKKTRQRTSQKSGQVEVVPAKIYRQLCTIWTALACPPGLTYTISTCYAHMYLEES